MSTIKPRSLSQVVSDLRYGDKPLTKTLAEEAVAAVAADGVMTRDELRTLLPYADGIDSTEKRTAQDAPAWKKGTETGRAIINGLANMLQDAARRNDREFRESGQVDFMSMWSGGWMTARSPEIAKADPDQLLTQVRDRATGWVYNSVDELLGRYPKATVQDHTQPRTPLPWVREQIDNLVGKWRAGLLPDGKIAAELEPFLKTMFR